MEENQLFYIPAAVFHTVLFAYQKALKDVLGSGQAIFVHPVLATIKKIDEKYHVNLAKGDSLENAFNNLSHIVVKSGVVKAMKIRKIDEYKYECHVEGCIFAHPTHELLHPEDVTCPLAILAMSIYEKVSGKKVKFTTSKYTDEGATTIIEPL